VRIWRGSFPALALWQRKVTESYWATFYGSYVQSYLERDVRQLKNIGNEASFLKFLRLVAVRTAQVLNLTDLARAAAIAPNTAKSWLSVLRASHVIYLLPPYHRNAAKRWTKSPKLFFSDTGLCSYLLRLTSPQALLEGSFSGALLETFVIGEIRKSYLHNGREPPLFFYRDTKAREIDLLVERDQRIYPVEIKQTSRPQRQDIRAFDVLLEKGRERAAGALLCLTDSPRPLSAHDLSLPIWAI
jgi:predicted AAA+ superfamily ATPase